MSQHAAQGTTLALLVPPIGILGAWTYWNHGDVDLRIAAFVCIGFLFGSLLGARLATHMPNLLLERIFGGAPILIGIKMLLARQASAHALCLQITIQPLRRIQDGAVGFVTLNRLQRQLRSAARLLPLPQSHHQFSQVGVGCSADLPVNLLEALLADCGPIHEGRQRGVGIGVRCRGGIEQRQPCPQALGQLQGSKGRLLGCGTAIDRGQDVFHLEGVACAGRVSGPRQLSRNSAICFSTELGRLRETGQSFMRSLM